MGVVRFVASAKFDSLLLHFHQRLPTVKIQWVTPPD